MPLVAKLITRADDLLALREAWTGLHTAAKGTVFQSFEWLTTWWALYGDAFTLRVGTFWKDGTLVALLPCFRLPMRPPGIGLARLRLMGEYEIYGEYKPLVHPAFEEPAAAAFAAFLAREIRENGSDLVDFNNLPAYDPCQSAVQARLADKGLCARLDPHSLDRMMLALPADVDQYLKGLSKRARQHIKYDERALFKQGVRHISVSPDPGDEKAMGILETLHAAAWKRKGLDQGYFVTRNRFKAFLRRVLGSLFEKDAARIHFLMLEDQPIAVTLTLEMHGHYTEYVGGFDPGHPLSKHSPGKILSSFCIRDAIRSGCTEFDFQGGREDYKFELGCTPSSFSRFTIFERGLRSLKPLLFTLAVRLRKRHFENRQRRRSQNNDRLETARSPNPG